MAPADNRDGGSDNGILSTQKLLYGALSLIVLLSGATWSLFNTNHNNEIEDAERTNRLQWERIRDLNDQAIRREAELERLRKDVDDQEARIRTLEHRGDKR